MPTITKIILIMSDVIAYLILSVGYYYMALAFYASEEDPLRHELGMGIGLSFIYGFWPVFLSIGLLSYCKCEVPTWLFRFSVIPFILWILLLIGSLFF